MPSMFGSESPPARIPPAPSNNGLPRPPPGPASTRDEYRSLSDYTRPASSSQELSSQKPLPPQSSNGQGYSGYGRPALGFDTSYRPVAAHRRDAQYAPANQSSQQPSRVTPLQSSYFSSGNTNPYSGRGPPASSQHAPPHRHDPRFTGSSYSGHGHDFATSRPANYPSMRAPGTQQQRPLPPKHASPYNPAPPVATPRRPPPQPVSMSPMQIALPSYLPRSSVPAQAPSIFASIELPIMQPRPNPARIPSLASGTNTPKRKGGRPKGSKNKSTLAVVEINSRRGPDSGGPTPARVFYGSDPTDGQKRRGRPPRASNSTEAMQRALEKKLSKEQRAADKAAEGAKKRGRPFKDRGQPRIPVPAPRFLDYLCQWEGCRASLQNLETLKQHVYCTHRKKGGEEGIACKWGNSAARADEVPEDSPTPFPQYCSKTFPNRKAWKEHIAVDHFEGFSWHMGDGPQPSCLTKTQASKPGEAPAPWMKDADGDVVTPSLDNFIIEAGIAKINNKKRYKKKMKRLGLDETNPPNEHAWMKTEEAVEEEIVAAESSDSDEAAAVDGSGSGTRASEEPPIAAVVIGSMVDPSVGGAMVFDGMEVGSSEEQEMVDEVEMIAERSMGPQNLESAVQSSREASDEVDEDEVMLLDYV